ncbi:YwiC-like family protein [Anaeromyxobacter oryzisoli]|uniref:YwiC-like family protein n=1 Tax=Anaeromyxobacter oryzisoli TaxID=2925408 RepID=UPI001F5AAF68|nr:YwiC-like family protein [Anaeromyxobacter sp. SG63]
MTTTSAQLETAKPRGRSLLPHEHGAWGQLAMPLLTALAIGRPAAGSLLLTAAIVLAFVAHEPLLVVLGQRGWRVRQEDGARALRWLVALAVLAAVTGLGGVLLAPPAARLALLLPAGLAAAVAWLVHARREKTTLGEVVVAAALASAAWAVALAGGAAAEAALAALLAWILAFAAAILGVRVILVRVRSKGAEDPGRRNAVLAALLAVGAAALSWAGLPVAVALATLPTVALSIVICLARFSPKRLRELGWALVGSSAVTLAILVAALR